MYVSKHHALPELGEAQAPIEAYPLGAWVAPLANHVPFLLDRSHGKFGTLLGHVSCANPVCKQLLASAPSVVMLQGPQSYITPGWYPGKQEHGKVVPTWNYAVAHAHGAARAIDDEHWLRDMPTRLTAAHESSKPLPWQMTDAPADFIDKLLRAVVGIEIPIERLVGRLKASHEALQDRLGTASGLAAEGTENAAAMACLVERATQRLR